MSNMTTKSDFAQKLLTDLRQRKERMAAAQNSGRQSNQTSRVTRGNSGQASRGGGGGRQINVLESAGKTSRRSNAGTIKDSSNQIVLYEGSTQSSRQVKDLQMAIAFAFENSGNLTTIGGSTTNPLVNFFNRFSRKFQKTQTASTTTTTFYNRRSSSQIPTVSHIHVNEISKGVHKLNQILTACSNGLNFDRNSIEIGRELLKGAINLEESLRMLVNLQDASDYYSTGSQKKSRLKLLDEEGEEEEEEEEDDHNKKVEQWKLDRPRFSFDKTNRQKQLALTYDHESVTSLKVVPHRRSNSCVQDLSSSKTGKEKGRISNVVAKLMGLEEIPQKGDLREISKQNQPRKDFKMPTVEQKPAMVKKQQINVDLQKKVQNTKMMKTEDRTSIKMQQEITANNNLARNQEMVPKRADSSEEKKSRFAEQKPQKPIPAARNQANAPKPKRSSAMNVQKKLPHEKPIKPNTKDPPNRRHQDASANQQESPKIESQSLPSSKAENEVKIDVEKGSSNQVMKEDKAVDKKRDVTRKVQRREVPQKMEVMVSRRNASGKNLTKSMKRPDNMLKDLKQQMQRKNRGPKRIEEEQSDSKGKEVKLETKDDQILSKSVASDEFQDQKMEDKLDVHINSDSVVSNKDALNDLQKEIKPSVVKAEGEELKKFDQSIENHEEITEPELPQQQHTTTNKQEQLTEPEINYLNLDESHEESTKPDLPQQDHTITTTNKQEQQLTEPEKTLKETVLKSQLFLSTAEALFKLNIPLSFLHATYLHETESKSSNLVLDSAHEILKRKARRLEATHHPFIKTAITTTKLRSLDDLIRHLCKDLEALRSYGMSGNEEGDVAAGLHRMLSKDIYGENADVNCMWDLEWGRMKAVFGEVEDLVKDVERFMMNGLLDEIAQDFLVCGLMV